MLDYVPRPISGARDPPSDALAAGLRAAVAQAPAPERPIEGGMATEALLAHVLVASIADHLPLYRKCCSQHLR